MFLFVGKDDNIKISFQKALQIKQISEIRQELRKKRSIVLLATLPQAVFTVVISSQRSAIDPLQQRPIQKAEASMSKYDVFISYSHKDKAVADAICHYFENDKLKCWIAPRDIMPGQKWAKSIAEAVKSYCWCFLRTPMHPSRSCGRSSSRYPMGKSLCRFELRIFSRRKAWNIIWLRFIGSIYWIKKSRGRLVELTETITRILQANQHPNQDITLGSNKQKKQAARTRNWILLGLFVVIGAAIFFFRNSVFAMIGDLFENSAPGVINAETAETASPRSNANPLANPDRIANRNDRPGDRARHTCRHP